MSKKLKILTLTKVFLKTFFKAFIYFLNKLLKNVILRIKTLCGEEYYNMIVLLEITCQRIYFLTISK